jgi:hypothetical protein
VVTRPRGAGRDRGRLMRAKTHDKEEDMKRKRYHYSGDNSTTFWRRVRALKGGSDHAALYAMGCILQNIEEYVLQQLTNAEVKSAAKTKSGA